MNYQEKVFAFLKNLSEKQKQDFCVAKKYKGSDNNFYFTTWIPLSQWTLLRQHEVPNYREILSNEIVFESDLSTKEENLLVAIDVMRVLEEKNFNFWCVFTGNKSYHVHLLCDGLLEVSPEARTKVKQFFAKDWFDEELHKLLDFSNFGNRRLIQIEVAVNPKTGNTASLLKEKVDGTQPVVPNNFFCFDTKMKTNFVGADWKRDLIPKKCNALEYCLVNKVPSGFFTRYEYISASLAAYIRHKSNRTELAKKYYLLQGKMGDLEAWDKKPSNFCCEQVRRYMEKNGLGKICEKCLLRGDSDGGL